MLLASVGPIRDELGFDDMPDINDAIEGALHNVEHTLASVLGMTSFELTQNNDLFWVPEPGFRQGPHCETVFRLRNGFVNAPIEATYGFSSSDWGDALTLNVERLQVDLTKGTVTDVGTRFYQNYARFVYTSGFPVDEDNPDAYDAAAVPGWLKEVAKAMTRIALADNPSITEAGITTDTRSLQATADRLIAKSLRYTPTALMPV